MNATTTLTRTPYWARFAAHDLLDVDWSDHDAAHRGVMTLRSIGFGVLTTRRYVRSCPCRRHPPGKPQRL